MCIKYFYTHTTSSINFNPHFCTVEQRIDEKDMTHIPLIHAVHYNLTSLCVKMTSVQDYTFMLPAFPSQMHMNT